MDLLRNAYSNPSDEEPEPDPEPKPQPTRPRIEPSLPKRPRLGGPLGKPAPRSKPFNLKAQDEPPQLPGRYISKRERALTAAASIPVKPTPPDPDPFESTSSVPGSLSELDLPHDVLTLLRARHQSKGPGHVGRMPERLNIALQGHTKAVNAINWSMSHAHLLASAGMDHKVFIWNVWSRGQKAACILRHHGAAVKDVKWSNMGWSLLSCGYDCTSRLTDVESGMETQVFKEDQAVNVIKFHPQSTNLFLSGGEKGHLRLWDIRTGKVIHEYIRRLGPILDVEFADNGRQFISSSDVSISNISENSIIVWDVAREIPLSNQVYGEAYTCPCIRLHPIDPCFVAQSNGNYIAIFTSSAPFRLDKYRRYEGHDVSGFPIKCNFSLDGQTLATGSNEGSIYFYNYKTAQLVRKIKAYPSACIDVAFHPTMSNVVASCSWSGDVSVVE